MAEDRKHQRILLAEWLNRGRPICRDSALTRLGIQNLTARLSELRHMGFPIIKETERQGRRNGRAFKTCSWRFKNCFNPGDLVRVEESARVFFDLKGRLGRVCDVDLYTASVLVRLGKHEDWWMDFNDLSKVQMKPGMSVTLDYSGPLILGDYHPNAQSWVLLTPNAKETIIVPASLVRPIPAPSTKKKHAGR